MQLILSPTPCRSQVIALWRAASREPPSSASDESALAEANASRAACAASLLHQSDLILRSLVREYVSAVRDLSRTGERSAPATVATGEQKRTEAVNELVAANGLGAYTQLLQSAKARAGARLREALDRGNEPRLSDIDPSSDAGREQLDLVVRLLFKRTLDEILKLT